MVEDIRDKLFLGIENKKFSAVLRAENSGCISGMDEATTRAGELRLFFKPFKHDGDLVRSGEALFRVHGYPKALAVAEEQLIGALSKFSGIATAARKASDMAGGRLRIVAGAWKKMPGEIKSGVRKAVIDGGAAFRITDVPMIYLDKNYIRMFGSIALTLKALAGFKDAVKVVQIRGEIASIEDETQEALEGGAGILMVDTGNITGLERCAQIVRRLERRRSVELAYSGGIILSEIPEYCKMDIDMLCIGREIVDAPLLDMSFDICPEE
jgi:nicotinate-nucleotide pyrophosphorylase (carboxylating)